MLASGDKVRGEPIECVSTGGVLCNGSTADSESASLGSNPSTPSFGAFEQSESSGAEPGRMHR